MEPEGGIQVYKSWTARSGAAVRTFARSTVWQDWSWPHKEKHDGGSDYEVLVSNYPLSLAFEFTNPCL